MSAGAWEKRSRCVEPQAMNAIKGRAQGEKPGGVALVRWKLKEANRSNVKECKYLSDAIARAIVVSAAASARAGGALQMGS